MGKLIYAAIASLDGYIADRDGNFDWAEPGPEAFRFINELERPVGTYLYGRRIYEVMTGWETMDRTPDLPDYSYDFAAIWQAAEKIVYSRSLETVPTRRTRLAREFHSDAVRELKAHSERDLSVGGPALAGQAIAAGLVDEYHLFVAPVVVGGGLAWLPPDVRLRLRLLDERRFDDGMVYLRYASV